MWHVGLLYRVLDLMEFLAEKPSRKSLLLDEFRDFHGVDMAELLRIAEVGSWLEEDHEGTLSVSSSGQSILGAANPPARLRRQVWTLLTQLKPAWGALTLQGRKAFAQYAPAEAVQCFREAGALDPADLDVIAWWDRVAAHYRQEADAGRMRTAREGEKLSCEYELRRTGKPPEWTALEYEGAGYDLRSIVSRGCQEPLLIEVKTSRNQWNRAVLHVTRNEWEVLRTANHAVVHLWCVTRSGPDHAIVPTAELVENVPSDNGRGRWEVFQCPFSAFQPRASGGGRERTRP